tara:strand:- start:78 stop:1211 length:1134 start_codon:yes stop_codon:yes gene_type:complete
MKNLFFYIVLFIANFTYAQSYDVLFIGNSYTYYNNLPEMISNIANDLGDTVNYDQNTPGGTSLYAHSQNQTTINKINQQNWDFVVLQDQSQRPSLSPSYVAASVYPYATQLVNLINSNYICSEPVFYMTWGRKYGDQTNCQSYPPVCTFLGMQERLRDSYLTMGLDNNASVSPVGIAFKNSISLDSTIDLYTSDNSHPSIYGSYLAACTFYSTIFKKSSVGCSYKPNAINQSDALFLQQVASSTVLDSMFVWNVFQAQFDFNQNGNVFDFINKSSNFENCIWDFGDGNQSTDFNPTHTYLQNGVYDVILTIQTNSGCLSEVYSLQVNVNSTQINEYQENKKIIKSFNILGNQINENFKGVIIEIDSKGKSGKKIYLE